MLKFKQLFTIPLWKTKQIGNQLDFLLIIFTKRSRTKSKMIIACRHQPALLENIRLARLRGFPRDKHLLICRGINKEDKKIIRWLTDTVDSNCLASVSICCRRIAFSCFSSSIWKGWQHGVGVKVCSYILKLSVGKLIK